MKKLNLITALLFIGINVAAQETEFERYQREQQEAFNQYKQKTDAEYQQYIDEIDREFANYLKENWSSFQTEAAEKKPQKPKPSSFPTHNEPLTQQVEELPAKNDELIIEDVVVAPTNYNEEVFKAEMRRINSYFYGENTYLNHDLRLSNITIDKEINPTVISDFWQNIASTEFKVTLRDIQFYQQKYGLNDYGTYLLIKKLTDKLYPSSKNLSRLATWYFLSKMGYKAKVGYNENAAYLMLPSQNTVYGITHVTIADTKYYLLDYDGGAIYTYKKNYGVNTIGMNFLLKKPLKLKEEIKTRNVSFTYQGKQYEFDFTYNQNAISFFKDYPHVSLQTYFSAGTTSTLKESIKTQLSPVIEGMDEVEALSFLLAFVQNAFPYQIDDEQFGYEKVFFPEEFLHYPYSDCEDRSIFFSYLVKVLLNKEVIGLNYPKHVATAVNISEEIPGKYYTLNGKKFIVCDPTYINAPVGSAMSKFSNETAKIIN